MEIIKPITKRRFTALFLLGSAFFGLTEISLAQAPLTFNRCQISSGSLLVDAQCASLTRAEDPDSPDGRSIELFIAKFPADTPEPEQDAFTIIQGGPGGSSIDLYLQMRHLFSGIRKKRDIIVVDQRGTGRSNMLTCPVDDELVIADFSPELAKRMASECVDVLSETNDLRFYTTSIAVQDLEAMRIAAGYPQLSIYGTSYGTRVAQHYLRRFPEQTRAVVLDGVVQIGLNLAGGEIARRSQQAFDRIVMRCNDSKACSQELGNIEIKFKELRERLRQDPVDVAFSHPSTGEMTSQRLNEQSLLSLVRLLAYSSEQTALLPLYISQAHAKNYVPLAAWWLQLDEQFADSYAIGMNNSVVCAEDNPFVTESDMLGVEDTYFGLEMVATMQSVCETWPRGPIDEDFRTPFKSNKPVLILSGEVDPITPPANGEVMHKMLANSLHITVPTQGHGVIGRGCVSRLAANFIEAASLDDITTDCVDREQAMPLFIDFTGPTP